MNNRVCSNIINTALDYCRPIDGFSRQIADLFIIEIQLGAILAVILLYCKRILNSLLNLMPGRWEFKFWSMILAAFIPSAVLGILFSDYIEKYFSHK